MGEVSDERWEQTRWVCTEFLEPATAAAVARDEPERFRRAVLDVERALAQAKQDGDFTPLHARYSGVMTFFSGRGQLALEDLRRCANVSLDALHACAGDVSAQARWGGMTTRILETYGDALSLRIEWRPLYEILAKYLAGEFDAYNGAIPTAVHVAVVSRLAHKARRHFSAEAPSEIWHLLKPKIRALENADCFEGLGMLHLLMPCSRVSEVNHTSTNENDHEKNDWCGWFEEWVTMAGWMPTNRFWRAAWFAIFAQLAKHDVGDVLNWDARANELRSTCLWFMEVPVGGGEGACPFGRRTSSRAAYLFSRSVNDSEQRCKYAAKYLAYRLPSERDVEKDADAAESAIRAVEALVDVVENYAHPSNAGRWTNTLAQFLTHAVKYFRKRVAAADAAEARDENGAGRNVSKKKPTSFARARFAAAMRRLVDKGMYNKVASLRFAAASSARDLAYIEPASILPLVMSRFAQAVDHGTATHQLTSALSVLTFAMRPMVSAPRETFFSEAFADAGVPDVGQFLAFVMETTLPGIDANDPSKTLGVIRLYVAVVSNLAVLADPGDPANAAADEVFPFQWSDWIDAALGRFFVFFENVDPASAGKIDGADKHRGGAGGDGGASYLMGSSSMYSPLVRLVFARMSPSLRERAVKRVANFVLTSTHSGLTHEVGQMVMAAATQAPEETYAFLTKPLLESLAAEVEDVASLAAERARQSLEGDASVGHAPSVVSPTKEAKLRWQTGLLGAALHYGGPKVVALAPEIRAVLRALFALCAEAKSLRLGEMAAHVSSLLCGALTGTYVVDLFAADEQRRPGDDGGSENARSFAYSFPAKWSVSKVVYARDGRTPVAGATHAPRPFAWRAPAQEDLNVAREMAEEFVHAPCDVLLAAFGEGGDPSTTPKEKTRALLASIGGAASGFRLRMADFEPERDPETNANEDSENASSEAKRTEVRCVLGVQDVAPPPIALETRARAARALAATLAAAAADDTETIGLALSVAEDILAPCNRDYRGCKAALRTWRADASALTTPPFGDDPPGLKTRPRWLLGEYAFLRFLWRASQAAYHRGGPNSRPSKHPADGALMAQVRRLTMHKYASVRAHARALVEQRAKRFPAATVDLVAAARDALAAAPGDEDRCVAACALLKCTPSVNRMRSEAAHFRATSEALLRSSHHDAEKAQTAVNEVFLSMAIRFSRGARGVGSGAYAASRRAHLDATRDALYSLMAPPPAEQAASGDVPAVGASLHWSYALMANAFLLFLAHPESLANNPEHIARFTGYLAACVLGPTKALRLPATCALLMVSRYEGFEAHGVPTLRRALQAEGALGKALTNAGLCHHIGSEAVGGGGRQTSRADALLQAAESLYGAGADMSGAPWPRDKGGAVDQAGHNEGSSHFIVACARLFKLFARVAPETVASTLEKPLTSAASAVGDRGARVAAAEALAGVLASPHVDAPWAAPLLLKTVAESAAEEAEEWLRAVRYAVRGEAPGEGSDDVLRGVLAADGLLSSSSTTAREARRLEAALACVSQLTSGKSAGSTESTLAGLAFQEALVDELADEENTPLARDSRAVREEAAKVASALAGAHLAPEGARRPAELFHGTSETTSEILERLRAKTAALLESFAAGADEASRAVLLENPAEAPAKHPRASETETFSDARTLDAGPLARQRRWLEGALLTVIQLAKHGEIACPVASEVVARCIPAILRAQETPDRDFALVAKRALTYLKYVVFPVGQVGLAARGALLGLRDDNWHARAAALKFAQAFTFRHAFVLDGATRVALYEAVVEATRDPQIEVRALASTTLVGFLRGGAAADGSAARARDAALKRASTASLFFKSSVKDVSASAVDTHGAVLGLASCVLSAPYDVPEWMPATLEALSRFASCASAPVRETVRRTFGEFKKTHQDTWLETKAAFTSEQWENVSAGMELAPSYIS